jgi:hypothetical protein
MLRVRANYQPSAKPKAKAMDEITRQARQGSVAAIIQVLNEKLADSGVRTRAIFAEGILQLLCEAPLVEQLEQSALVDRVRQILEAIAPRNIRRVNINSRIVREQQLLWLEEINRDPENQLLWSEEITLAKPHSLKRFLEDLRTRQPDADKPSFPKSSRHVREQRQFWRGIVGGTSLSLLVLLAGWVVYNWLGSNGQDSLQVKTTATDLSSTSRSTIAEPTHTTPAKSSSAPAQASDPFAEAVRMAERANAVGKSAKTPAQWLDLAAKWQQASDLMSAVPAQDARHRTAQDRIKLYRQYSEVALQEATKSRSQPTKNSSTR